MHRAAGRAFKTLFGSAGIILLLAAPARADLITINFTGQVDLTSEGGEVYQYSGFFTWNSNATPHNAEEDFADYALANYSLIFDGVDVTIPVSPNGAGNGITVLNDADPFDTGNLDGLGFLGFVGRPYDPTGDLALVGVLTGPTTMFNSTALPGDLSFLASVTSTFALFIFEPDGPTEEFFIDPQGTFNITGTSVVPVPVPEPGTLGLAVLGLAGALARARRGRRPTKTS